MDTRSKGCDYQRKSSSFHMNLPGLNIPSRRDLFVNVSDLKIPTIEKSLTFVLYYGFDTKNVTPEVVKKYTIVFSSLTHFAAQLNCAIVNDFLYKSKCVEKEGDEGPIGGMAMKDEKESIFYVRYVDGMFQMQLDEHCAFFATDNLFQFMGFYNEVRDAKSGDNKGEVLTCDQYSDFMKVCKRLTIGAPKEFFSEDDRVCHLVIDNCMNPVTCYDGGGYNVICSYDLESKKLVSHFKRFFGDGMRNISFCVLNNNFKPFNFGCCLKTQSLRFVLNVAVKI